MLLELKGHFCPIACGHGAAHGGDGSSLIADHKIRNVNIGKNLKAI